jgi:hypothetical protein
MAKYDALRDYLRKQTVDELTLTFSEIETIIMAQLPPSTDRSQWWSNVGNLNTTHIQRRAWGDAGFDAHPIKGLRQVTFRKRRKVSRPPSTSV